jgi:hypothetical protein
MTGYDPDAVLTAVSLIQAAMHEDTTARDALLSRDADLMAITTATAAIAGMLALIIDQHGGRTDALLQDIREGAVTGAANADGGPQ